MDPTNLKISNIWLLKQRYFPLTAKSYVTLNPRDNNVITIKSKCIKGNSNSYRFPRPYDLHIYITFEETRFPRDKIRVNPVMRSLKMGNEISPFMNTKAPRASNGMPVSFHSGNDLTNVKRKY